MYKEAQSIEVLRKIDKAYEAYTGDLPLFSRAVGAYFVGRRVGWKILYIIHDTKTLKKYEACLGIRFREVLNEFEDRSHKTNAYKALKLVTNFWKFVKGETDVEKSALTHK
ncbi:MAG: hypothetical protein SFV19_18945 [Rhodospirillaceae bacterium]|nr:hypothetical protein [Rhodospirillaceae bacterium]